MMSSRGLRTLRPAGALDMGAGRLRWVVDAAPAGAVALGFFALWLCAALLLPHGVAPSADPANPIYQGGGVLAPLLRWDGYWYATIAGQGYHTLAGRFQPYAFFPLLPGLAAAVHRVLPFLSVAAAGLAVNAAALAGSAMLIDRVLASWPRRRRLVAIAVLFSLPSAFFYATFYSEALFLFASALTVWALADPRREAWVPVGVLLATLDRPPGALLVVLVLAAAMGRRAGWRPVAAAAMAAALGIAVVMGVDAVASGNPLAFLHAQAGWSSLRTLGLGEGIRWVLAQSRPTLVWHSVISFGYWDFYLSAAVLWIFRRRLGPAAPYAAIVMAACFVTGGVGTQSRYLVTLLPLWLGLLQLLNGRSARVWMLTTGIAIAGGVLVNLWMLDQFIRGLWAG